MSLDDIQDGIRHRTEYCIRIEPKSDPRNKEDFKVAESIETRFNGIDEECVRQPQTTKDSI